LGQVGSFAAPRISPRNQRPGGLLSTRCADRLRYGPGFGNRVLDLGVLLSSQVHARGSRSGRGRAASRRISASRTIRPNCAKYRSERARLDRLVHLHSMSPVLPSDLGRDERFAGTARQDQRFIGKHLGRSRARLSQRSHRLREQIRRICRPLVVFDRLQAVDVRTCAEPIQARARRNASVRPHIRHRSNFSQ
jgi:hypothetical protein